MVPPLAADDLLTRLAERDWLEAPGVVYAALLDGEIVERGVHGQASLELDVALSFESVMHAGSVAKPLMGVALLRLEAEGHLSLDDPLDGHLDDLPSWAHGITLRQALQHTSGLKDYWALSGLAGQHSADRRSQAAALALVRRQQGLNFPAGSRHLYSNTGYLLLAEVVGRVTGRGYPEWLSEALFEPLGMTRSRMLDDPFAVVEGMVPAYRRAGDEGEARRRFQRDPLTSGVYGSGNLLTTVPDLLRFGEWLLAAELEGVRLVERLREQPEIPGEPPPGYGLGVAVGEHRGLPTLHHGGANGGYRAHLLLFPDEGLVVAVLSNAGHLRAAPIAEAVAERVLVAQGRLAPEPVSPLVGQDPGAGMAPAGGHDVVTGMYLLENGLPIRVREVDGQAVLLISGSPHALRHDGGLRYLLPGGQGVLAFRTDRRGRVVGVRMTLAHEALDGQHHSPEALSARELREYTGDWYSAALGTGVTLVDDGAGGLRLEQPTGGRVHLAPLRRDLFLEWDTADFIVAFERDRRGRLRAFTVSVERAQRVRFERP